MGLETWQTKLFEVGLQRKAITPHVREGLLLESDLTPQRLEPLLVDWVSNGTNEKGKSGYSKHYSSCAATPDGGLKHSPWKITIPQTHAQQAPNTQVTPVPLCVSTQYIRNYAGCPAKRNPVQMLHEIRHFVRVRPSAPNEQQVCETTCARGSWVPTETALDSLYT